MNVRKLVTLLFIVIVGLFVFNPNVTLALSLYDDGPVVNTRGIDTEKYEVNKTISDKKVVIELYNKINKVYYSWTFDKEKIGDEINLNFELSFDSPKKEQIDALTDVNKTYLSFAHHGLLPDKAEMKIFVGDKYKDGNRLYLYYYNEEKEKIEYIDNNIKVVDGYITFNIEHCSDYFLTTTIVNDAVNNPMSMNYVIVIMVVVVIVLVAATIFTTRK